jgi:hypothetical protein
MAEMPEQENGLSRRALLRGALLTGVGAAALSAMSIPLAGAALAATGSQSDWGWCNKCSEFFWATNQFKNAGGCAAAAGGPHTLGGTNYTTLYGYATSGNPGDPMSSGQQAGWRWCNRCSAMFWPGALNACPANTMWALGVPLYSDNHVAGGTNYDVRFGYVNDPVLQDGWTWCYYCGVLYWSGQWGRNAGNCLFSWPNGPHTAGSSSHYQVQFT